MTSVSFGSRHRACRENDEDHGDFVKSLGLDKVKADLPRINAGRKRACGGADHGAGRRACGYGSGPWTNRKPASGLRRVQNTGGIGHRRRTEVGNLHRLGSGICAARFANENQGSRIYIGVHIGPRSCNV